MNDPEKTLEGMTNCPLCLWSIPYYRHEYPLPGLRPSADPTDHRPECELPDIFCGVEEPPEAVQAVRNWLDQEFAR
jgi:hypothetical protein